ncbi:hypothetical protein BCR44DRAFT_43702, partial [Catenaria anguillulae PL171]
MARNVEGSLCGSVESLVDINTEIVELKQKNRELEIVISDSEERYAALQQEYDEERAIWEEQRAALHEEVRDLKAALVDVKQQLRKTEVQAYVGLETQEEMAELRERLAKEKSLRKEEQERWMHKLSTLESELTLTKAELSIARLAVN